MRSQQDCSLPLSNIYDGSSSHRLGTSDLPQLPAPWHYNQRGGTHCVTAVSTIDHTAVCPQTTGRSISGSNCSLDADGSGYVFPCSRATMKYSHSANFGRRDVSS